MGRKKLPIDQKRLARQYYLTKYEHEKVDNYIKNLRKNHE